jgi:hypothetical protein
MVALEGFMIRLRDACLAVMVTAACSPVFDPSNVPDAAIDAPDPSAPKIVSSYPDNMQAQVSVLTPISLFMDRRMDPASITQMTVRLRWIYSNTGYQYQYVKVSYDDAARKISIVPNQPMYASYRYEVIVNGVKDLVGNELTDGRVNFLTYVNYPTRYTYYNANGTVSSGNVYQLDMNGRPQKVLGITGTGPDNVWHSADDVISCCVTQYTYAPDGRQLEYRYMGNVGPDAKPNTADDIATSVTKYNYDAMGLQTDTTYTAAGPDGVFGNGDDTITAYNGFFYMDGFLRASIYFDNAGLDGQWKTADDRTSPNSGYTEYVTDANGNRTRQVGRNTGADGIPRNADDGYSYYYEYTLDTYGYVTQQVYRNGAGTDGMWLTADDTIGFWYKYVRDENGLQTGLFQYNAVGTDGMWLTADDPVSYWQGYTYGETKQQIETAQYTAPGTDGMWGTADDPVSYYARMWYDANGNRVDSKSYVQGPDGLFKTSDDRVSSDNDFDLTK